MQPKMNVCRANCDVIWEQEYIKNLQQYIASNSSNLNAEIVSDLRNRLNTSKKRLFMAKKRLIKTKATLRKVLYGRRADMSMKLSKPGPTFES
jgi:Na+/phosphate symporter